MGHYEGFTGTRQPTSRVGLHGVIQGARAAGTAGVEFPVHMHWAAGVASHTSGSYAAQGAFGVTRRGASRHARRARSAIHAR